MKALRIKSRYLLFLAAWPMIFGGCTREEEYAREVTLSREAAYRQWETRKTREESLQPYISGELSVEDSVKLTLLHNKTLQRTLEEREVARGQQMSARSAYLPNVSFSGEYRRIDAVTSFDIPGPGGTTEKVQIGNIENYTTVLSVSQPIYAGGAIQSQVRAARLFSLQTDEVIRGATQEAVYQAETAYYDLLRNQHLVEIATDAARSAKANLDDVEKRRAGGVVADFDVLQAQVELSNREADLIKTANAIDIARANLIRIMGVAQGSDFVLSGELTFVPAEISMEQAVETALKSRPDLYRREFEIRRQKELLQIVRSRYLPVISGFFDNTWAKPDPKSFAATQIEWGDTWVAGFRGQWSIFDGFQREGEIIQQRARLRQAQIDLVDTEETALYELTQALLTMENAARFVVSQRLNLTRATEQLRLAEVGYAQGVRTAFELIETRRGVTEARVNYFQAIHAHVIAKLALLRAMGTILQQNGTSLPPAEPTTEVVPSVAPPLEGPTEVKPSVQPPVVAPGSEGRSASGQTEVEEK